MLIIPAIDIKGGKVVRLKQGDFDRVTTYAETPVEAAKQWKEEGARLIHIVDLDGASEGRTCNLYYIQKIVEETGLDVEFGGGVRSEEDIERLLDAGVKYVVLGTAVTNNMVFLKSCLQSFGERIVVAVDVREGMVAVRGWKELSSLKPIDFALNAANLGVERIIYTDVAKDGMLEGPNVAGIREMINSVKIKVTASGGISTLEDVKGLKILEQEGVWGMIIGKALYEGKFTLKEAMDVPL